MKSPTLGSMPLSAALSGVTTFMKTTAPMGDSSTVSSSSLTPLTFSPFTLLAAIVSGTSSSLSTEAISVGPSSPPIPLKLAQKIWRNEFIELHNLLPVRLGIPEPTLLDVLTKPESTKPRKEIKTIQQWALCFNSYVTILAQKQPHHIGDLLAYISIIINASGEYEDTPWLQYDARFRQQAATEPSRPWAMIDASLWTTCFSTARSKPRCRDCKETGHETCQTTSGVRQAANYRYQPYSSNRPICKKFNYAWCDMSPCTYQHCRKPNHKIAQCPDTNKNPEPFRPPKGRGI